MKSFISIFGAFLFSIFSEGFIRVIIIFYHKSEFSFFGLGALPSPSWIWIIFGSLILIYWLSGMLIVTVTGTSVIKHLTGYGTVLILWRIFELLLSSASEPLWYYVVSFVIIPFSLFLCYLTQQKTVAKTIS